MYLRFKLHNSLAMTDTLIREQIKYIQAATTKALESKEAAKKFLIDAGIITEKPNLKASTKKRK